MEYRGQSLPTPRVCRFGASQVAAKSQTWLSDGAHRQDTYLDVFISVLVTREPGRIHRWFIRAFQRWGRKLRGPKLILLMIYKENV